MENVTQHKRKYTLKQNKDRFFFPSEYMKFYDALNSKQKHTVYCLINTGARINEMRNVVSQDIDFKNKRLILRVTKTKAAKGEKKGRTRTIPISSQFARYLEKFCNGLKQEDKLGLLSTPSIDDAIKNTCKKIGLQDYGDFSAHNLRKTLETWLLALGVNDLSLMAHFAHDPRTAARHYVSPDIFSFDEKKQMRIIIGDLYER